MTRANPGDKIVTPKAKLNLGSGKDFRPTFLNIEINERFQADVYADITKIELEDNHYEKILARDILDQITNVEARRLLRKCNRWLKPKGIIEIHLPNLEICALLAAKGNTTALEWLYGSRGEGAAFYETNWKKWAYTKKSLNEMLEATGFKIIEQVDTCVGYGFLTIAIKEE